MEMIVRFMKDGKVQGGSYSKENGIISGGEVLELEGGIPSASLPAYEDRLRGLKLHKACRGAEDAAS